MVDPLRVCCVGAGALSGRRIYPLLGPAGAKLLGVCDLDKAKAEERALIYGGNVYSDVAAMLDAEKPQAVIVCIGPEQHASLAKLIMRKGYPVYTEKPAAPSAAEAWDVAKVAKETGMLCTTAFKKRYSAAYDRAKRFIDSFPVEDRYCISADYASAQYQNETPRNTFILDFAIHMIDVIAYLYGDVAEVSTFAKGMDAYAVNLRFVSGAVGSLSLNDGRSFQIPTEEVEISLRGGNFMTLSNSSRWRITQDGKPSEWREPSTFTRGGDSGNDTGHLAELVDFVAAVREGRSTRSNIVESAKSLALYEAIRASAENGGVITPVRYAAGQTGTAKA
jgi:predicted dehydrogenase